MIEATPIAPTLQGFVELHHAEPAPQWCYTDGAHEPTRACPGNHAAVQHSVSWGSTWTGHVPTRMGLRAHWGYALKRGYLWDVSPRDVEPSTLGRYVDGVCRKAQQPATVMDTTRPGAQRYGEGHADGKRLQVSRPDCTRSRNIMQTNFRIFPQIVLRLTNLSTKRR